MGGRPSTSMRSSSRWSTPTGDGAISQTSLPFPFPRIKATHLHLLAIVASLVLFCCPLHSHTFYVTNTRDDGSEGTFRWATEMCDWYPITRDTILFAIPTSDPGYDPEIGVWTIRYDTLANHFPCEFRNPGVLVDGLSQREFIGYDVNPLGPEIELKGPLEYGYDPQGIDAAAATASPFEVFVSTVFEKRSIFLIVTGETGK